jgi:hypothetical protein
MATFRLTTAEACNVNFVGLHIYSVKMYQWNSQPREWSAQAWATKRFKFVFTARVLKMESTENGNEVWLNATPEAILELRAALPFGYHVDDDGRLHREALSIFGEKTAEITLDLAEDGGAMLHPLSDIASDKSWFHVWVGIEQASRLNGLYAAMRGVCDPVTLGALAARMIYQKSIRGHIYKKDSRSLLRTEKPFLDAIIPMKGYVRDRIIQGTEIKAGRKVILSTDDEHEKLVQDDFLATRCTKGAGASFVRFGLRWNRVEKSLKLSNFETNAGVSDWNRHEAMLLIHKAKDAWRTVALLPMFYYAEDISVDRLRLMPCFYMVPITVSKNEVTFAHLTFRGVKLATQQRIWDVDGMSMAISHALMSLTNQLKKMPSQHLVHGQKTVVPKNHRVAMLGYGVSGTEHAADIPVRSLMDRRYLQDGPYNYSIYNGSYPTQITRAADILDDIFSDLPHNRIVPGPQKVAYKDTVKVERRVRL